MSSHFDPAVAPGEPHELLARCAGEWSGTTRTWFEPEVLADEAQWSGSIRLMLEGRFAFHEYRGSLRGTPLEGLAIFGYDRRVQRWQGAWADSAHTGTQILWARTAEIADPQRIYVLGTYPDGGGEGAWGWRTMLELASPDELCITHFSVPPGGLPYRAVETDYRRVSAPPGCVFCTADGGEVLWRDALCRIVLAADPQHPLLLRVIFARHVREMTDLATAERNGVMERVFAAEAALRAELRPDKVNLASLGNAVPHVHWHVVPRWRDDAFFPRSIWSTPLRTVRADERPSELGTRLREHIVRALRAP